MFEHYRLAGARADAASRSSKIPKVPQMPPAPPQEPPPSAFDLWFHRFAVLGVAGSLALAAYVVMIFWVLPSEDGKYFNTAAVESPSPLGTWKAVVFQRRRGVAMGAYTQVSVLRPDRALPNAPGNIFTGRADGAVTVQWLDERRLHISGATATPYLRLTEYKGIRISYD